MFFSRKQWMVCLNVSLLLIAAAGTQAQDAIASAAPIGRFLVVYRNGQIPGDAESAVAFAGARFVKRHEWMGVVEIEGVNEKSRVLLAADPAIELVVPDLLMKAHQLVTRVAPAVQGADALYHSPQGWAVRQVGGFGSEGVATGTKGPWDTTQGFGVRIAILDSGVDRTHLDLAPNVGLNLSETGSGLATPCDDASPYDQQGHGTWTASLAAGALGATTGLVAGVAPRATILNIKVLQRMPATKTTADPSGCLNGEAVGLLSWMIQGIEDAVTNHADVISMSFGALVDIGTGAGAGQQVLFNRVTSAAANAGVILIAAAGNDGFNTANKRYVELPAQSRGVVAIVAATNPACAENLKAGAGCVAGPVTLPYYSNYGSPLNALSAPGGSYPLGGSVSPATPSSTSINVVSGWVTGACSSGKPSTLSGLPSVAGHSLGCFNLGHAAYVQAMGTSASAPLVAGAAALLRAAHPTWTAAAIIQALRLSAVSTPAMAATPQVSVAKLLTPVR